MWARFLALVLSIAAAAPPAVGASFDPFTGPKPLAILIEQNPWLMVVGSDTPRVAIYEDGEVMFVKKQGETYSYHHATLSAAQLQALEMMWMPILKTTPKKNYKLSNWTDQSTVHLFVRSGDVTVATSAYGLGCPGRRGSDGAMEVPPDAFFSAVKALCNFETTASEIWTPQYIEVMLWGYSYAPDRSIYWPKEWPDLKSERARKRGDSWSVFLDGRELPRLRALLATQKEKGAIKLDGKKWAISYRFTFPNEPMWKKVLWRWVDNE